MTANKRFTKKHKQLIKAVAKVLGSDRPYYVDLTNSNHLKFLIEGIEKPMYTSGTPSDCKSNLNFISDIKRALSPTLQVERSEEEIEEQKLICGNKVMETCIAACVQDLRQRKAHLEAQERKRFAANQNVDELAEMRAQLVKKQIDDLLVKRRERSYIRSKELRIMQKQVRHHLDFMLPNLSAYQHEKKQALAVRSKPQAVLPAANDGTPMRVGVEPEVKAIKAVKLSKSKASAEQSIFSQDKQPLQLTQFMAQQSEQRINAFRKLNKSEMLALVGEINEAIRRNESQAIDDILAKVAELELPKELLIERLKLVA